MYFSIKTPIFTYSEKMVDMLSEAAFDKYVQEGGRLPSGMEIPARQEYILCITIISPLWYTIFPGEYRCNPKRCNMKAFKSKYFLQFFPYFFYVFSPPAIYPLPPPPLYFAQYIPLLSGKLKRDAVRRWRPIRNQAQTDIQF